MNRRELLTGAAWLAGAGSAHAFGLGRLGSDVGHLGSLGGVGAAAFAPYPAPAGFHWDFVTSGENGNARVTSAENSNQPVVALLKS